MRKAYLIVATQLMGASLSAMTMKVLAEALTRVLLLATIRIAWVEQ